ncbi:hypothetical protein CspHIS471_0604620 [Cutaneotrichosporon sp. HIS471]|nr:hypothetical protein CspHIS471_0604620 [Cutaneotrichosporon sp. HIS471]
MVPDGGTGRLPPPPAPIADSVFKQHAKPMVSELGHVNHGIEMAPSERVGGTPAARGERSPALNGPVARAYGEVSSARDTIDSEREDSYSTPPTVRPRRSPPGSAPSEEAAALLLNFSAVHEPLPPPALKEEALYPHTPPHDSPATLPREPPPPSLVPSSPVGLPTPAAPSPETSTSTTATKPKRKRKTSSNNAVAGPSRHSSTEPGATPAHHMGEDNARIRCICGIEDDDGFTVQCEGCYAWQHAKCFGYPNGDNLPEVYYCEKCDPRPFDAGAARELQLRTRGRIVPQGEPAEPNKKRPKAKRPRVESGSSKPEAAGEATDDSRDPMAPPAKPRRKPNPTKPRSKDFAQPGRDGDEDDYFRVQPWELEYTPLKENLVRGILASRAIAKLRQEWVDGDEEPRLSKPSYHESGLPSPTETGDMRQSPDIGVDGADFNVLAPPLPPVYLIGADLESLAAQTYLRPVDDPGSASCYLPLKYIEPSQNIYARPTIYGVFVADGLSAGSFLGEYRCEVLDAVTYRKDPINQYSALGIPKPYVHSVGPPVNLMLDARSYGNEMRFVRSGCHPNAVIRPVFFKTSDTPTQKLHFGIFAARELSKNEEIVLGWEWDDQHVVHTLRAVIDSTLTKSANKPPVNIDSETVTLLTTKFDAILTNIFSTFQSCACTVNTDCAFAQMRRQVMGQTFHGVSGARARKRIDLGELVGAVRGWRKREIEEMDAYAKAKRFRNAGEWELWRAGPTKTIDDDDDADTKERSRPSSERAPSNAPEDEAPADEEQAGDDDVELMDVEPEASAEDSTATMICETVKQPGSPVIPAEADALPALTDGTMDVDEVAKTEPHEEDVKPATAPEPIGPALPAGTMTATEVLSKETKEDVDMGEAPRTPDEPQPSALPPPSSALSSIPPDRHARQERHEEGEEEIDDGYVSNATTATMALSDGETSSPNKPAPSNRRRVLSPVTVQRKNKSKKASGSSERRASKAIPRRKIIRSSDGEGSDDDRATPKPATKVRRSPQKPKSSKSAKRPKASKTTGSESDDEDDTPARKPSRKPVGDRGRRNKVVKDSEDEDHSPKSVTVKTESAEPSHKASPPPSVPAMVKETWLPSKPPREAKQVSLEPLKQPSPIAKEPTPEPKEPTPEPEEPAPKESTPAPSERPAAPKEASSPPKEPKEDAPTAPPKKVSLKDYLASHKIRKNLKSPEPKDDEETAVKEEPMEEKAADTVLPTEALPTQPARLNFLEHLPSARSTNSTPVGTPFTPGGASAAGDVGRTSAFVPRSEASRPDYFNTQPAAGVHLANTPAFVPRPSPNFVPRGSVDESSREPLPPPLAFQPRQPDNEYPQMSPVRQPLPLQTPPGKFQSLPDIPPALPVRDGPPHHGPRAPPTGPRHAPTGPRGAWGGSSTHGTGTGANAGGGPASPVNSMRGGFGGPRPYPPRGGGFDRGYGFRVRGHPRGRGGRM